MQDAEQAGQGSGAGGAVRGAAAGALIGEIANDDASEGAAWGVAAGAVRGRRQGKEGERTFGFVIDEYSGHMTVAIVRDGISVTVFARRSVSATCGPRPSM